MLRKTVLLIGIPLSTMVYASDIELIVKYKDNKNKTLEQLATNNVRGTSNHYDYEVIDNIDSRTKLIKVNNYKPSVSTSSLGKSSKIQSTIVHNKENDEYAAAKKLMDTDSSIKYAIPKNSKMYAYNSAITNGPTSIKKPKAQFIRWGEQWDMEDPKDITGGINAYGAWDLISNKTKQIDVAVIDSGLAYQPANDIADKIDNNHQKYYFFMQNGQLRVSESIYDNGSFHGTHVAGTIAANGPKVKGVGGPVDGIKILPIRALGDDGSGDTYAILESLKWAAGGKVKARDRNGRYISKSKAPVKVVNLSLGMSRIDPRTGYPIVSESEWKENYMGTLCPAWNDAISKAHENGITVVIAAGNDGKNLFNDIPSGCKNIDAIVVESTGPEGLLAPYSTYYAPDGVLKWAVNSLVVRAPGGDSRYGSTAEIYSTLDNYGYGYMQGTSMASPHVAGIIALLYQELNDKQPAFEIKNQIEKALENSKDIYSPNIVNAKNAVQNIINSNLKVAA
ncbi:S8 family serine peptidase [Francisella sp. Scap27]|uniref:S8 family serine peptidase n=1 Tax=Francisella sp. Scap27 TaxID=2589986 RepID=UPI002117A20C|nr:S8 family serine peptidase [Francisella sp. Scap27]